MMPRTAERPTRSGPIKPWSLWGRKPILLAARPDESGRCDNEAGFTLLELLVVIAILGLLIGLVAPAAIRQLGKARASVARDSIERVSSVLDLYKLDVGSYPSTDQGLEALIERPAGVDNWNGPYLQGSKVPLDPWSHPYVYRNPSERAGLSYDLCSKGPDEAAGQEAMICNGG